MRVKPVLSVRLVNRLKSGFAILVVLITGVLLLSSPEGEGFTMADLVLATAGLLVSGTVAVSVKVAALNTLAVALARVSGILSVFALILLIAAGTLGGGFNLSSENAGTAVLLGLLSLTGLSALLWPHRQGTAAGS